MNSSEGRVTVVNIIVDCGQVPMCPDQGRAREGAPGRLWGGKGTGGTASLSLVGNSTVTDMRDVP